MIANVCCSSTGEHWVEYGFKGAVEWIILLFYNVSWGALIMLVCLLDQNLL